MGPLTVILLLGLGGLAPVVAAVAATAAAHLTPPPPSPAVPLPGDAGPCGTHEECVIIMALFAVTGPNTTVVQRNVSLTDGGYSAVTTSENGASAQATPPQPNFEGKASERLPVFQTVASLLQTHVESMRLRMQIHAPINTWDPFCNPRHKKLFSPPREGMPLSLNAKPIMSHHV